jgi:hypothetical protein
MKPAGRRRSSFRLIIAAFSLLTLASSSSPSKVGMRPASQGESPAAAKNETRLRKLHLVRPDLIPYPIAYEVYC